MNSCNFIFFICTLVLGPSNVRVLSLSLRRLAPQEPPILSCRGSSPQPPPGFEPTANTSCQTCERTSRQMVSAPSHLVTSSLVPRHWGAETSGPSCALPQYLTLRVPGSQCMVIACKPLRCGALCHTAMGKQGTSSILVSQRHPPTLALTLLAPR